MWAKKWLGNIALKHEPISPWTLLLSGEQDSEQAPVEGGLTSRVRSFHIQQTLSCAPVPRRVVDLSLVYHARSQETSDSDDKELETFLRWKNHLNVKLEEPRY